MTTAFLGFGSNLGDRESHLARGLAGLRRLGRVTGVSSVWETDPVGFLDQPEFLNLVARLETGLDAPALLDGLREIERGEGRARSFRNAPRPLDIDILLYGQGVMHGPGLTVPHPRMHTRAFALVPLLELAPDAVEPGSGRSYREYLEGLARREGVGAETGYDAELRHDALGVRRFMDGEELLHGDEE